MSAEYLLLALVFLFFGGVTGMAYMAVARRRQRIEARLEQQPSSDPTIGSTPELVLGDMTEGFGTTLPMTTEGRSALQRELQAAGMYRPTALMEYAAVRAVMTITPLIIGGLIALLWTETQAGGIRVFIGSAIVAMMGFSLPRLYLHFRGKSRKQAIERGLPTALDMLTLCLSAGLNVINSLDRVAGEIAMAYPDLAFELQLVRRQADLRTLEFALVQFAERVDLPQLRNVSVILSQSEKLGTDGISVLREYSDNLRINMKQHAEAVANRAPLKMLVPGWMMGIGIFILVVTPAAMEVQTFREENVLGNTKQQAQEGLKEVNMGIEGARNVNGNGEQK